MSNYEEAAPVDVENQMHLSYFRNVAIVSIISKPISRWTKVQPLTVRLQGS